MQIQTLREQIGLLNKHRNSTKTLCRYVSYCGAIAHDRQVPAAVSV
ncbi:hypothetical protein [Leptolyngbya sp. AN02str]